MTLKNLYHVQFTWRAVVSAALVFILLSQTFDASAGRRTFGDYGQDGSAGQDGYDGADGDSIEVHVNGETSTYMLSGSHCLLYTSPSPRDLSTSRMPSSA